MSLKLKRPTSQQVAELAGVSRTTVSFVLNKVAGIPPATRARVLKAARDLDYVPDAAARTLASGRTHTLGLIIHGAPQLEVDAFLPRLLSSLFLATREYGFQVIVDVVEDFTKDSAYLDLARGKQIDGLIIVNPRTEDRGLHRLIDEGYPVVVLGTVKHAGEYSVVHVPSSKEIVEHLIALGHRHIAYITFAGNEFSTSNSRLSNYQRALQAASLAADPALVRYGNYSAESGYVAMKSLLARHSNLSAVSAGNDTIALGAMAAVRAAGLRVPEDIAVVGYDDIPVAAFSNPALTTVKTPALEQGRLAGAMLVQLVRGETPAQRQVSLATKLVVRQSCGAP